MQLLDQRLFLLQFSCQACVFGAAFLFFETVPCQVCLDVVLQDLLCFFVVVDGGGIVGKQGQLAGLAEEEG